MTGPSPEGRRGARELARRMAVWTVVAFFLAVAILHGVSGPTELDPWWLLLGWIGFPVVGAVILTSRRGNRVGRILLLIGLCWAITGVGMLPVLGEWLAGWWAVVAMDFAITGFVLLPLLVLVFPSGRLSTRLGRVMARVTFVVGGLVIAVTLLHARPLGTTGPTASVSPLAVPELLPVTDFVVAGGGFLVVPLLMAGTLVDLVQRWRRSSGIERLQFRWFAFGVGITVFLLTAGELSSSVSAGWTGLAVVLNTIPVCIGIAITRYGLYEIGRVMSRTVSYAIVTVFVVAVYALVVTLASRLVPDQSSVAVAAATLAAAGLFWPVLRRVQRLVDRRFDRERYDAAQVVDAFGERLRASVDPTATNRDLVAAVERTLQPSSVGVWAAGGER